MSNIPVDRTGCTTEPDTELRGDPPSGVWAIPLATARNQVVALPNAKLVSGEKRGQVMAKAWRARYVIR
jgi:hypothetical protein